VVIGLVVLLGVLVGAGVNYVADELLAHQRTRGRPSCPVCGAVRPVLNWVATIGFVTGRFRCPGCAVGLPLRHLVVELGTAGTLAGIYLTRGGLTPGSVLYALYACIFLVVLITDLEQRLIFNVVILPAIVVALVGSWLPGPPEPLNAAIGAAVGFGFFFVVALLKPGGMGAGDIKLAAFIGAVVGFPNIITALVIGIFAGGFVSLILVLTRVKTLKSYIAYGPFLVFGGAIVAFLGPLLARWARAS
jgi:leader peptidase (prepilin peptidase) / N-methyltransferase